MRKLSSFGAAVVILTVAILSLPQVSNGQNSPYCETVVTHFAGDPPSEIKLTIENTGPTSMIVEIESNDADPVDFLLVLNGSGATISAEDTSAPGKISRTLSWASPPATVNLNILWSKQSFGGNWQLSTGDITVNFADTCGADSVPPPPPPPIVQFCDTAVKHFGGDPPSEILLTIGNTGPTTMKVEIESNDADPVDFLLVLNGSGASISGEDYSVPGKISRTLTWTTPPTLVDLNVLWSKQSFGGNWQLSTGDVTVNFADTCAGGGTSGTPGCTDAGAVNYNPSATIEDGSCQYNVTFNVDMSCSGETFNSVSVTGPFCGWCATGFELSDPDSNGIYSGTFVLGSPIEYKYMVNGFASQENLIDDMQAGASCAPVTDYNTFANRLIDFSSDTSISNAYGTCFTCADPQPWHTVKFAVDMSQYAGTFGTAYVSGEFNGWCGGCNPLSDTDGDGIWTGTITTVLDSMLYKFQLDQWNAQENLDANDAACTKFDGTFTNRFAVFAQDTVCLPTVCFEECGPCSGTPGCIDAGAVNYNPSATIDDGSCQYNVTFNVDMSCSGETFNSVSVTGPFCGWCATGFELSDPDSNGIYSGTFVVGSPLEYKYMVNGFASQENLIDDMQAGASCAPVTDYNTFANRLIDFSSDTSISNAYGTCFTCADPQPWHTVKFAVDMSQYAGTFGTAYVSGEFNGWCGGCNPLSDTDGDGIWTGTITTVLDSMLYKFQLDQWNAQENLDANDAACTKFDGTFTNRFAVFAQDTVCLPTVCFEECGPCSGTPGCIDAGAVNYNPSATIDDGSCQYNVTFNVDMSCSGETFNSVSVTGPFCGWCATGFELSDPDSNGIYSGTFVLGSPLEYKYMVNGFASQENLIDDMQAGASCAPVTDYNTFANRLIEFDSTTSVSDAYGTCFTCADPQPWSLVKFAVDMNNYQAPFGTAYVSGEFNGWCGGCNPLSDTDGDGIWTGSITTVLDSMQYKFQLDQWNAQENLDAGDAACTKFDGTFTNRFAVFAQDTVCLPTVCFEECGPCVTTPDTATITFIVDMSLVGSVDPNGVHVAGSFQGWNPSGTPMTDIGNGQWSVTIPGFIVGQAIEFKYINGNVWGNDESVFGPCGAGNGNRLFVPTAAGSVTVGPDCFGSCGPCQPPVDITFIVDMSQEIVDTNGVHIVGPFNGFNPSATPMTHIGNNQYSVTLSGFQAGSAFNFKYINGNSFATAENVSSGSCAANNGFGDRTYTVPTTNSTVGPDCFNLCGPCPICPAGQIPYEIFIGASNSQFPNEMSWMLINQTTGDTILERACGSYGPSSADTVCLDTGDIYVFNANDDWGDGWNGGFYIITDLSDNSTLASGFPNNTQPGDFTDNCVGADTEASVTFVAGGAAIIPGCTDPSAINYNPQATVEDSSCNFAALNDVCDSALALTVIGVSDSCNYVVQSTNNATADSTSQSLCDPVGVNLDLWYTFVAPPSGNINFDIILGTTPLVEAAIYEACGDSVIGCFNTLGGTAFSGFTPGQQYVLQIWTDDFNAGIYGICLQEFIAGCTDPLATNYNPSANVDDGSCTYPVPANDNCQDAIAISCGDTAAGTTLGASADTTLQPCGTFLSTAPGVWYKIVGNGDTAVVSTCGSTYDTKLGVFTGGCNNLTCVTGNDDACGPAGAPPRQSVVKFATQNGVTYRVYVTGFGAEAGQYTLSVDCIPTKCKSPKNVNSTQLTASTARLCWDASAGADNYVIRGNKVGANGYVYLQTSSTCITVGGLSNDSYYWQVQAVCSGNSTNPVSAFSERDTFTMLPCANPTGVMTTNITSSSATLTWDAVSGANGYKIRGREVGTNSYANLTVTNNSYTASGLKPNTSYEWTVRVICGNGVTSNASALQTFTTTGGAGKSGALSQSSLNMNVYPNPAKNYFILSASSLGTLENVQIQIFDLSGKMIHGLNNVEITGSLEIQLPSNVVNGVYQIMVMHQGQTYQEKLVIVR